MSDRHPPDRRRESSSAVIAVVFAVTFDVRDLLEHAPDHCPPAPMCVSATSGPRRAIPFELAAVGDSASPAFRNRPGGPQCHNRRPEIRHPRKSHQHLTLARPAPVMPRPARRASRRRRRAPIRHPVPNRPVRRVTHRPVTRQAGKAATRRQGPDRPDHLRATTSRASRRAVRRPGTRVVTSRAHHPAHPSRAATPSRVRRRGIRSRALHPDIRRLATASLPPATVRPPVSRATARPEPRRATRRRRATRHRRVPTPRPAHRAAPRRRPSTSPSSRWRAGA